MSDSPTKITLKDVARLAGVSTMTVSKVLNQKPGISEKTRDRVFEVADQLHYTPNLVARSLRTAQTKSLGVVLADSSEMVTAHVVRGIQMMATQFGYSIILSNTSSQHEYEHQSIKSLIDQRIDGLLLVAPIRFTSQDFQLINESRIPFVHLMRTADMKGIDYVTNDNIQGGYEILSHVFSQGYKKPAFLGLNKESRSGKDRIAGWERCLSERGLNLKDFPLIHVEPQIDDGYFGTRQLFSQGYDFDVIICGCDLIAVGAIKALDEKGLLNPQIIGITGYDDIDLAGYLRLPLTTMHQPLRQIGQTGMKLLYNRLVNPSIDTQTVILKSSLVPRESTRRVNSPST